MQTIAIQISEDLIYTMLDHIIYDADINQPTQCSDVMMDAIEGHSNSRTIPRWNRSIENNFTLISLDMLRTISVWGDVWQEYGVEVYTVYLNSGKNQATAVRYLLTKGVSFEVARRVVGYTAWLSNDRKPATPMTDDEENEVKNNA